MKPRDITDWFFDVLPYRRRSSDMILASAVGLGVGIAAGVGIGMLLAPRPGAETRAKLRAGAGNIKEKARDLADRARGQLETATQQFGHEPHQQSHSGEMLEGR